MVATLLFIVIGIPILAMVVVFDLNFVARAIGLVAVAILWLLYALTVQTRVRRFIEPVRPARRKVLLDADHTGDQGLRGRAGD